MQASNVPFLPETALPDAADLVSTLRSHGYLRLPCEGASRETIQAVFAEGDSFFSLPVDVKLRSSLGEAMEGYRGFASEHCEVEDRPDLCESFWLHAFNVERAMQSFDASALPLYRAMQAAADQLDNLVTRMTLSMEEYYWGTAADAPQFQTRFGSHLQLNYYEPTRQQRDLLLDPHEDGLLFTLLQSTASGLEIRTKDGSFEPVETGPDELFVMPGEIATLLSGGEIEPLYHRVRTRPDVPKRMSLMYFSNPNARRHRQLRPWHESPLNAGVDIMQRVIDNPLKFGLPPIPIVDDER